MFRAQISWKLKVLNLWRHTKSRAYYVNSDGSQLPVRISNYACMFPTCPTFSKASAFVARMICKSLNSFCLYGVLLAVRDLNRDLFLCLIATGAQIWNKNFVFFKFSPCSNLPSIQFVPTEIGLPDQYAAEII